MRLMNLNDNQWKQSHGDISNDPINALWGRFDRMVEGLEKSSGSRQIGFSPSCDINETKNHFLISLDVPGVQTKDFSIEVVDGELKISGERHKEEQTKNESGLVHLERSHGKFERIFSLPKSIDADNVEAQYKDGVLNVILPKIETAKPRLIEVQSGEPKGILNKILGQNTKKQSLEAQKSEPVQVS